jgi:putative phosphoribosyl transferase
MPACSFDSWSILCTIMHMYFQNREDAGNQLAAELKKTICKNPIVVALPRGGVPVAERISRILKIPLDVLVVRKIGAPDHEELGVGAITESGAILFNHELMESMNLTESQLIPTIEKEIRELARRIQKFRHGRPFANVRHRDVLLIDDGLATGYTAAVAAQFLKKQGAKRVILAVPVCSTKSKELLEHYVDKVVCLYKPEPFYSVGLWYENFDQTSDTEVMSILSHLQKIPETWPLGQ